MTARAPGERLAELSAFLRRLRDDERKHLAVMAESSYPPHEDCKECHAIVDALAATLPHSCEEWRNAILGCAVCHDDYYQALDAAEARGKSALASGDGTRPSTFPRPRPMATEEMPDREWTDEEWVRNQWWLAHERIAELERRLAEGGVGAPSLTVERLYEIAEQVRKVGSLDNAVSYLRETLGVGAPDAETLRDACEAAYDHLDTFGVVSGGTRSEHESQERVFALLRRALKKGKSNG